MLVIAVTTKRYTSEPSREIRSIRYEMLTFAYSLSPLLALTWPDVLGREVHYVIRSSLPLLTDVDVELCRILGTCNFEIKKVNDKNMFFDVSIIENKEELARLILEINTNVWDIRSSWQNLGKKLILRTLGKPTITSSILFEIRPLDVLSAGIIKMLEDLIR